MAHDIRIVTEAQLRQVVELDLTAIDVVEKAFAALASGKVVMPPILSMDLPDANGEVDVKPPTSPASTVSRSRSVQGSSTTQSWDCPV